MVFKRTLTPLQQLNGDTLTAAMVGIGMNFAAVPAVEPNIEDTLLAAAHEAMEHDDFRILAVLVTWLSIHHTWINADRLLRAIATEKSVRTRAFWSAMGKFLAKDKRFVKLKKLYKGPAMNLLPTGTEYQIHKHGEDPRFVKSPLRVPANVLRSREDDVLSPSELAKRHRVYRYRILMGPSYRADMWAALDKEPSLSSAQLARIAYGSFATAWQVKHHWKLIKGSHEISMAEVTRH